VGEVLVTRGGAAGASDVVVTARVGASGGHAVTRDRGLVLLRAQTVEVRAGCSDGVVSLREHDARTGFCLLRLRRQGCRPARREVALQVLDLVSELLSHGIERFPGLTGPLSALYVGGRR
jgi:hypothetical protein